MYYVYIIESLAKGIWYYGESSNPERRLRYHNLGESKFTKNRGPWKLIFLREFHTRSEAVTFEKKLKSLKNKKFIQKEFGQYFIRDGRPD